MTAGGSVSEPARAYQEVQGITNENGDVVVAGGNVVIQHYYHYLVPGAGLLQPPEAPFPDARSTAIATQEQNVELYIHQEIERRSDLQDLLDKEGPSLTEEIVATIKKNCSGM